MNQKGIKKELISLLAKKSCDFGNAQSIKLQQDRFQRKPGTSMAMIDEKKKPQQQAQTKSTSSNRKQRSTSKSNGNQTINFKQSFDSQRQYTNSSNISQSALPHNISKDHLRSFTKFQSIQQQQQNLYTGSNTSNTSQSIMNTQMSSINNQQIDLSNIDSKSDNIIQHGTAHHNKSISHNPYGKQDINLSKGKMTSTPYQVNRHSEYNNNEEDYTKSKKDEVIKTIFKKRKEKMQTMDSPQETITQHASSSSTFDALNYQHHSHNLSQFDNPINKVSKQNPGGSVATSTTAMDNLHHHSYSISKVLKDKKYRKYAAERTQTPPPPTTVTRMINTQNSNDKTLQNSSSFISKKQTPYIKPKDPDDTAYTPNTSNNQTNNKIVVSSQVGKKINIKLNNFMKTSVKQNTGQTQQAISERQKRPQSYTDNFSILQSFQNNYAPSQQQPPQHQSNKHSTQIVQNFQLNNNINVKIQQPEPLSFNMSFVAHQNTVTDLACDNSYPNILYSSSLDYSIKVWNFNNDNRASNTLDPVLLSPFSNSSSNYGNIPPLSQFSEQLTPINNKTIQPYKKIDNKQRQKINTLLHLNDVNILATGGYDKVIRLFTTKFNMNKFDLLHTIRGGHMGVINQIRKIDTQIIASTCSDGYIRIFDLKSKKFDDPIMQFDQQESSPNILCVLNKNNFLTSGFDGGIRLWDIRENIPHIQTYHKYHNDQITSIDKLSSHIFASSSDDSNINMWDIRMPKMLKQIYFDGERIGSIKFIKQNHLVAAHDNNLTLMSFKDNFSNKQTYKLEQESFNESISTMEDSGYQNCQQIKAIAFSEQDRKLYLAGSDRKIHVWNINFNI